MASLELELYHKLSAAFASKGSLNLTFDKVAFDNIVKSNISKSPILWRGVSVKEILHNNFDIGSKICFNRLTSFTEYKQVAKDFSADEYGTHVIFKIENADAFNYSSFAIGIMEGIIEKGLVGEVEMEYMEDQISMLKEEMEWMIESERKYLVSSIEYRSSINPEEYTIIELVPEQAQVSIITG